MKNGRSDEFPSNCLALPIGHWCLEGVGVEVGVGRLFWIGVFSFLSLTLLCCVYMSARDNDLEHVALTIFFFFLGKNIFEQVDSYNCYILIQKKKNTKC